MATNPYAAIVQKYNPGAVLEDTPSAPQGSKKITPSDPYQAVALKYKQQARQQKIDAIQTQTEKDIQSVEHPGFFESAKQYVRALPGAAKQVITEPFKNPKATATSAITGLLDLGPTITRAIHGLQAMTGVKPEYRYKALPNVEDTEVGKALVDSLKNKFGIATDTDVQKALKESTTNVAAYELGGGALGATGIPAVSSKTVLGRVLGNVIGGQLTNESTSAKDRAKQATFDAAFGLATEGGLKIGRRLFSKAAEGVKVETPKEGIKVEEPTVTGEKPAITPKETPSIVYKVKQSLGKDATGEPVLAKTEVDSKTGRAIIYYAKELDSNPALKQQVLDHEYGHVLDKRISGKGTNVSAELPNYKGNQASLDSILQDFAQKQGKKQFQVAAELHSEISQLGGSGSNPGERFANSVAEYLKDPKKTRTSAPTFSAFMEHNLVEPRFSERTTTARQIKEREVATKVAREERIRQAVDEKKLGKVKEETDAKQRVRAIREKAATYRFSDAEQKAKDMKRVGMETAAVQRKIEGRPTDIELRNAKRYLDTNYRGKTVSVEGKTGITTGKTSFGKIQVRFKNGTRFISPEDIKAPKVTDAMALEHLKREGQERLKQMEGIYGVEKKAKTASGKSEKVETKGKTVLREKVAPRGEKVAKTGVTEGESMQKGSKLGKKASEPSKIAGTGLDTGKQVKGRKSFNPKSINAPDETTKLFEDLSKGQNEYSSQRISKGNEDIKDLARLTGLTEEDLLKAKPGSIANSETVTAARQLVLDKASDLMNYLKSIDVATASKAELKGLRDKVVKLIAMQKTVAGFRTEASNVFRSLGIELLPGENATLSELGKVLKEAGLASGGDAALFAKKVAEELKLTKLQKIGEGALATWYAAILSGPKTTVRNILSTAANIATEMATKFANPKQWKEIPAATSGLFRGLAQGWEEGKAVLKGAETTTKFMDTAKGPAPEIFTGKWKTYGNVVESVGRFLNAQDKFLSAGAREMERASLQVSKPGLDKALEDAISRAYAESTVYHGKPKGRLIGALRDAAQTLRRKFPESKIVVPFVDTVANVMDRQFDYLPVFSALRLTRSNLMRQVENIAKDFGITSEADKMVLYNRLRDQQIGRMALGTAVSGAAVALAAAGRVSGNGPTNYNEKMQLMETGWRPNSVKIGGKWIPYAYWGPLAGIFSMAGNIYDKTHYDNAPNKNIYDLIGKGLVGWTQTELDQSFLSGVSDLFDVMSGNTSVESYIKNFASGLIPIPAAYSQTKDLIFRQQYETRNVQQKIRQKLGITAGLEPRLNALGQPQKGDLIYGITPSFAKKDPVYDFLTTNQIVIAKPYISQQYTIPGKKDKRALTPQEYTRYLSESGKIIYQRLSQRIGRLEKKKDEDKQKEVQSLVEEVRDQVRTKILRGR